MMIFAIAGGLLVALLGFAALGLSQIQHWRVIGRQRTTMPPAWLRPTGWVLVGVSCIPPLLFEGVAFGALLWIGLLSMAAICVVTIFCRQPNSP